MSDFIAHVIAELDTAKAQQQMNAFTNAKHKIDVDVNLVSKNGNINGYLNQIKSQFGQAGNAAGNNFANALNTTMGKLPLPIQQILLKTCNVHLPDLSLIRVRLLQSHNL